MIEWMTADIRFGKIPAGTKATAFVGGDDNFDVVTEAKGSAGE